MKYFYSASVMGYGNGRFWHEKYNFPKLEYVTQTLTIFPNIGLPFAILKFGNTVWNKVGFHNIGFHKWEDDYYWNFSEEQRKRTVVSISGIDETIDYMVYECNNNLKDLAGIEINLSCPNFQIQKDINIPKSDIPIYLKLRYNQDPYKYDLDKVTGIRLNSVPKYYGGISGLGAQKYNWPTLKKWLKDGLNVAGCSCTCEKDINILQDMGCNEIGIGSLILINPKLVERICSM